jgi:heme-degrading monooxygenase HmoA|tara:strand:- start:2216 stop:2530 length:315 start_codon:yes stop_codon:yes gene_type:complete
MHTIPKNVKNCFAVIFSYELSDNLDGYSSMDQDTIDAVKFMDGYLGYEKFGDGISNVFISYWKDMNSVNLWKKNSLHIQAKKKGPTWYKNYRVQITEIHQDINH